jgi:hypothetical protein
LKKVIPQIDIDGIIAGKDFSDNNTIQLLRNIDMFKYKELES